MKRTKAIILLALGLAALAGSLYLKRQAPAASVLPKQTNTSAVISSPTSFEHGRQLAQNYCKSCHLFPEPSLLDRNTWEKGALPEMEPWLGLIRPKLEKRNNGQIIQEANVFAASPIISQGDWKAIRDYYREAAPEKPLPQKAHSLIQPNLKQFKIKKLTYRRDVPMTTLVKVDSSSKRLFVGDAMTRTLEALDSEGNREFAVEFDSSPISLRVNSNSLDLTLVGKLFPSDDTKGKQLQIRRLGEEVKINKILGDLRRPTDATFADLNGDGREDIVVCQFGNRVGRLSWFENRGNDQFEEHILAERPGAIRSQVFDMDHDGLPDIVVVMGQAREGVYLFTNQGRGTFVESSLIESHPLYGYTYFELVDFNKDGHIDILTANGDNGEYVSPPKNYHGLRIFLNDGKNYFVEKWFFPLHGAYKAMAADFNHDGNLDIAAISFFPDYENSPEESFVYFEGRGGLVFDAYTFPEATAGRWITMDVGDLDGDGWPDIALGSLILGPTTIPIPASLQSEWKTNGLAVLMLENVGAR